MLSTYIFTFLISHFLSLIVADGVLGTNNLTYFTAVFHSLDAADIISHSSTYCDSLNITNGSTNISAYEKSNKYSNSVTIISSNIISFAQF
jgi:hypothetical protein